jgi:hypothetical protein
MDRNGILFSYEECLKEKTEFELQNSHFWK